MYCSALFSRAAFTEEEARADAGRGAGRVEEHLGPAHPAEPRGDLDCSPRAVANPQSHEMQRSDGEVKEEGARGPSSLSHF